MFLYCNRYLRRACYKGKRFEFMVLDVSVQDQLGLLLWAFRKHVMASTGNGEKLITSGSGSKREKSLSHTLPSRAHPEHQETARFTSLMFHHLPIVPTWGLTFSL